MLTSTAFGGLTESGRANYASKYAYQNWFSLGLTKYRHQKVATHLAGAKYSGVGRARSMVRDLNYEVYDVTMCLCYRAVGSNELSGCIITENCPSPRARNSDGSKL